MTLSEDTLAMRVRQSLSNAGMSQSDLATAIGMDPTALSKALSGKRSFRPLELAEIADELNVRIEELLADPSHEPPRVAMAARRQPNGSPAVNQAVKHTKMLLELEGLLNSAGYQPEPNKVFSSTKHEGNACRQGEKLAEEVLAHLELDADAAPPTDFEKYVNLIESTLGIDVAIQPLPRGLDGLSVARGQFRLALISSGIARTRQRFTIAHEVAHLLFGDSEDLHIDVNVTGKNTPKETRANAFAAALLMPKKALSGTVSHDAPTEASIACLLARLSVSPQSLAYRLHNTGIINARGRDCVLGMSPAALTLRSKRFTDLREPNDHRIPLLLLKRAITAYVRGDIGIRPLASLLDVNPDELLAHLEPQPVVTTTSEELPAEMAL